MTEDQIAKILEWREEVVGTTLLQVRWSFEFPWYVILFPKKDSLTSQIRKRCDRRSAQGRKGIFDIAVPVFRKALFHSRRRGRGVYDSAVPLSSQQTTAY